MKKATPRTASPKVAKPKRIGGLTARSAPYVTDLLEKINGGKTELDVRKNATIFSQGDPAVAIYFIRTGRIRITVVSAADKEVVLATLGAHAFFGEGCLVGQTLRVSTAKAVQCSTLFRIEGHAMLAALHTHLDLSEQFTAALLARNIDLEENLCDQIFNHSEKRLARVLLKMARFGQNSTTEAEIPAISQEALAKMVGTTRSRIAHFMNKFKALGLIDYDGNIRIRVELLTDVVLHD